MEVDFEVMNAKRFIAPEFCRRRFGPAGGVIGRAQGCDWVIPDTGRLLSKCHAKVSFREGLFFLTDTSGNGISHRDSGLRLPKGEAVRIRDGDIYLMGDFEILARLAVGPVAEVAHASRGAGAGELIPDDAFLDLDPLAALDQKERVCCEIDQLINPNASNAKPSHAYGRSNHGRVDMEHLLLPELVEAVAQPDSSPLSDSARPTEEGFWRRFGTSLGMDLSDMDDEAREALAINVALLFKQSVCGLQRSLRTRSELKCELRLAQTFVQGDQKNALKYTDDALQKLLQPSGPGQLPASEAIARAFLDLQAHQVALLAASRATLRATLEHFSPRQLMLRLERDHWSLLSTSGRYWRAYGRYHQALCQDDDWTERLLARDFAHAYEEQVRLVSTLQHNPHG